jgi:hypothetical protein
MTDNADVTITAETQELIADLHLLPAHFTNSGVVERLVAQLTEKDLALTVAQGALEGQGAILESIEAFAAKHEYGATRWADPLPMPTWIPQLREVVAAAPADVLAERDSELARKARIGALIGAAAFVDDLNRGSRETGKFGAGIRAAFDQAAMHIRTGDFSVAAASASSRSEASPR